MTKTSHQIECKNLALSYDGKTVLRDVSFFANRGDYLCIVGENGSGKSTLVRALLGLKRPAGGEILFGDGFEQNEIGYLPQQTDIQRDFPASVREVVLSGLLGKSRSPFYSSADRKKAAENMEKLGISSLASRSFRELSGGQRQRVLLSRALCAASGLLLLDEPAAGLDPLVTKELYELIKSLNREEGMTVIMVSHDLDAALRDAKTIMHLDHSVKYFGPAADYPRTALFGGENGGEGNA